MVTTPQELTMHLSLVGLTTPSLLWKFLNHMVWLVQEPRTSELMEHVSSILIGMRQLHLVPAPIASIHKLLTPELVPSDSATFPLTHRSRELLTTNYRGELFSLMKMVPWPVKVLAPGQRHTTLITIILSVNTMRLTMEVHSATIQSKFVELHSMLPSLISYSEVWASRFSDTMTMSELNLVITLPLIWEETWQTILPLKNSMDHSPLRKNLIQLMVGLLHS